MPEKWIESTGPDENVLSKNAFEEWFKDHYQLWYNSWSEADYRYIKKIAFAAWEHQRLRCSDIIKQVLSTIKESTIDA